MRVAQRFAGYSPGGGGQPPQGLREEDPLAHRRRAGEVRRRLRRPGLRRAPRHRAVRHHRALRRLRLQQVPLLRLRARRLPDRLAEGELPGRVPRRAAVLGEGRQGQDGGLPRRVPQPRHRGARPRRQPLVVELHRPARRGSRAPATRSSSACRRSATSARVSSPTSSPSGRRTARSSTSTTSAAGSTRACSTSARSSRWSRPGPSTRSAIPRKGLCLVFEEIIDRVLTRRREEELGISTLFSLLGEPAAEQDGTGSAYDEARREIPDVEFDKAERLAFEKEMLGLYVSDHPLLGMESALRRAHRRLRSATSSTRPPRPPPGPPPATARGAACGSSAASSRPCRAATRGAGS